MSFSAISELPHFLRTNIFENTTIQNEDVPDDGSSFSSSMDQRGASSLGVIAVIAFTVILNLIFFVPAYIMRRRHRRLFTQTAAARSLADSVDHGDAPHQTQTPDVRYGNIESWVVSRTTLRHDALCSKLRGATPASKKQRMYTKHRTCTVETVDTSEDADEELGIKKIENSGNNNDADDASNNSFLNECPICFDEIIPGDVCSWSSTPSCQHVFHHVCIKEWLLKHEGCPFCRSTFLPIDDPTFRSQVPSNSRCGGMAAAQQANLLVIAHNERCRACYYCEEHGIVYLPRTRPSSISLAEWQSLEQRGSCTPTKDELEGLRGSATHGVHYDCKDADDTEIPSTAQSLDGSQAPSQESAEEATAGILEHDTRTTTAESIPERQDYSVYPDNADISLNLDSNETFNNDRDVLFSELRGNVLNETDISPAGSEPNRAKDAMDSQIPSAAQICDGLGDQSEDSAVEATVAVAEDDTRATMAENFRECPDYSIDPDNAEIGLDLDTGTFLGERDFVISDLRDNVLDASNVPLAGPQSNLADDSVDSHT